MTRTAEADIQPAIIQALGGHKDYQTTLGYAHIPVSVKLEAVNRLE
jgi:hypothetical protein